MKHTLIIIVICFILSTLLKVNAAFQQATFQQNRLVTTTPTTFISQKSSLVLLHNEPKQTLETSYPRTPHIIFPGGGIFFYWQAGAVSYLRENGYDLDRVTLTGASAGSLTATLTAANVDFEKATEIALRLAEEGGVWDRPLGLQGVWGAMIETWLDELLPENVLDMVGDRLSVLVTPVPSFGKEKISIFTSRTDLIKTAMASIHIPWFIDGKLTASYRGKPFIDGSFLSKPVDYDKQLPLSWDDSNTIQPSSVVTLDWTQDPVLANKSLGDAVTAVSKDGIWGMLARGREFAAIMEERGDFRGLPMKS